MRRDHLLELEASILMNRRNLRLRFWVEGFAAVAFAVLAVLTLVWHDWAESLLGIDPDAANGAFEIAVTVVVAIVSLALAVGARAEWRIKLAATRH
jgi:hypothetical protein